MRAAIASRPSGSGPITSNVHSGLLRSRCSDISPPTIRHRSAFETHCGSVRRRTCWRMSKASAGTQRGSGPEVSTRWVARGWESSRSATRPAAPRCPVHSAPGSRIISLRVCPAIDADSRLRMRPSSSERRSESSRGGTCHSVRVCGACNDEAHARFRLPGVPELRIVRAVTAAESCGAAGGPASAEPVDAGADRRRPRPSTAPPGCAARRPSRWAATGWCRRTRRRRRADGAWPTR